MRVSLAAIVVLATTMSWTANAMAADVVAKQQPVNAAPKVTRTKPAYPDGEIRGIFCLLPTTDDREKGLQQIKASVDRCKASGLNSLFVAVPSRYLAAVDNPKFQTSKYKVSWDSLGEFIRTAKEQNIQVHAWYTPWIRKETARTVELELHPEWTALTGSGEALKRGVLCFVRPEVRQFELDLISKMLDRYPDLAGIHIEEPGYGWKSDCCYCDSCRAFCQTNFGIDIRKNPEEARPTVQSLAAFMCTDFFIRLRKMMLDKRPDLWLSANGGYNDAEWYLGRDWHTWARRGLIDFYVPQIYDKQVDRFTERCQQTRQSLGACDLVSGIGISWKSILPAKQTPETIKAEIIAVRKVGGKGFVVFCESVMQDEHFRGIREAVQAESKPATTR